MEVFLVFSCVIVLVNFYVTLRLWKLETLELFQKVAQSLIIWLVPIIGALIIWLVIKDDESPPSGRNPNDNQGHDSMPGGVQ